MNKKRAQTTRRIMTRAEAIGYYRNNPVKFVTDLIGVTPEDYQADIMNSVRDNAMTTVRSGHGTGKTALESWVILWYLVTHPYPKIPCTAPTKHQLNDILWAELAKWINRSALKDDVVWTAEKIWLKGLPSTWFAVARTARDANALQGFHGSNLLFVIDEASGVRNDLFQPVLGALTEDGAKLLMCGNPTELSGFFYDSHTSKREMYRSFRLDGNESKRVSKQYIRTIIDMYGKDSDPYRVRVAGEFPKAMPDSFITLDFVERCIKPRMVADSIVRVDIGADIARYGDDETVLWSLGITPMTAQTLRTDVYRHNDTMQVTGAVIALSRQLHAKHDVSVRVKIDCDGLGVGVYDRLREIVRTQGIAWLEPVECHFGGKGGKLRTDDPIAFANSTGLMWGTLRARLKDGTLSIPADDKLIAQITNRKYRLNSSGEIILERKEEMKQRGVSSPDRADALALALYDAKKPVLRMSELQFI